ncbi:MAG: hypothetical protein JWM57_999 [Phycisphaerales bacterium]|nr:hypothetical protein [Phycisphaerales bacterium]
MFTFAMICLSAFGLMRIGKLVKNNPGASAKAVSLFGQWLGK